MNLGMAAVKAIYRQLGPMPHVLQVSTPSLTNLGQHH